MTTIVNVEYRGEGLYRITDGEGVRYTTKNAFLVGLAKRCRVDGTRVSLGSSAGWWYRDLYSIRTEDGEMEIA